MRQRALQSIDPSGFSRIRSAGGRIASPVGEVPILTMGIVKSGMPQSPGAPSGEVSSDQQAAVERGYNQRPTAASERAHTYRPSSTTFDSYNGMWR